MPRFMINVDNVMVKGTDCMARVHKVSIVGWRVF